MASYIKRAYIIHTI